MKTSPVPTSHQHRLERLTYRNAETPRGSWIFVIVISVVFGFLSGIAAGFFSLNFIGPDTAVPSFSFDALLRTPPSFNVSADVASLRSDVESSVVNIFTVEKADVSEKLSDSSFRLLDFLGTGVTLTSDGYIVAHKSIFSSQDVSSGSVLGVVTRGGKIFPIQETIPDPLSSLVFLKVSADNLSSADLSDMDTLQIGETLAAIQPGDWLEPHMELSLLSATNTLRTQDHRTVYSTDDVTEFIYLTSPFDRAAAGAPVFTLDGKMVGILDPDTEFNGRKDRVIPSDIIAPALGSVLHQKNLAAASLGVRYVNIARFKYADPEFQTSYNAGALLRAHNGLPSVFEGSPAADAGLSEGDIILRVESEPVDALHDLSTLLRKYASSETVELAVLREGKELILTVPPVPYEGSFE